MDPSKPTQRKLPRKKVSELLSPFQTEIFDFKYFNEIQSKMFHHCYNENRNLLISAPTASGKTVIFELCMLRLFKESKASDRKVIYIAPLRALISQMCSEWKNRLGKLGLEVEKISNKNTLEEEYLHIKNKNVILSTPEKWEIISRRWRDFKSLFLCVELIIIDEIQLLGEDRGACLEALVTRLKTILPKVRLVAASATIPSLKDVAAWLGAEPYVFGQEYRPVPLELAVEGQICYSRNSFLFDRMLNGAVIPAIVKHGHGKPSLVFCNSRKGCENCALHVVCEIEQFLSSRTIQKEESLMTEMALKITNKKLKNLLKKRVAFHHGGLEENDRSYVELAFSKGFILILCCTTTLSQGINTPAHLVIIKSTEMYKRGVGYVEYPKISVIQMIGRAGRPKFDKHGVAVIITKKEREDYYKNLFSSNSTMESQLECCMADTLCTEIDIRENFTHGCLSNWYRETFYYTRLVEKMNNKEKADEMMNSKCLEKIRELVKHGLIDHNENEGLYKATATTRLMNRFYLSVESMKTLLKIDETSVAELILSIGRCEEMERVKIRYGEKKQLNDLKRKNLRFPIKGRVSFDEHKVSILIQLFLMQNTSNAVGYELRQDQLQISAIFARVCAFLLEHFIEKRKESLDLFLGVLNIKRSIEQRFWYDEKKELMQVVGVDHASWEEFKTSGIRSINQLNSMSTDEIESILSKKLPFGTKLISKLEKFPRFVLSEKKRTGHPNERTDVPAGREIEIRNVRKGFAPDSRNLSFYALLTEGSRVLQSQAMRLEENSARFSVTFCDKHQNISPKNLKMRILSPDYFGVDVCQTLAEISNSSRSLETKKDFIFQKKEETIKKRVLIATRDIALEEDKENIDPKKPLFRNFRRIQLSFGQNSTGSILTHCPKRPGTASINSKSLEGIPKGPETGPNLPKIGQNGPKATLKAQSFSPLGRINLVYNVQKRKTLDFIENSPKLQGEQISSSKDPPNTSMESENRVPEFEEKRGDFIDIERNGTKNAISSAKNTKKRSKCPVIGSTPLRKKFSRRKSPFLASRKMLSSISTQRGLRNKRDPSSQSSAYDFRREKVGSIEGEKETQRCVPFCPSLGPRRVLERNDGGARRGMLENGILRGAKDSGGLLSSFQSDATAFLPSEEKRIKVASRQVQKSRSEPEGSNGNSDLNFLRDCAERADLPRVRRIGGRKKGFAGGLCPIIPENNRYAMSLINTRRNDQLSCNYLRKNKIIAQTGLSQATRKNGPGKELKKQFFYGLKNDRSRIEERKRGGGFEKQKEHKSPFTNYNSGFDETF